MFTTCQQCARIRFISLKYIAQVRFTFVSAQCVSPSSCITVSTFSFLSFEDKYEGRRRDAENKKFSCTVRVPMTTSSCNNNTTQNHPAISTSSCNINTSQHHTAISTLFCNINTLHHPAISTPHSIIQQYQNNDIYQRISNLLYVTQFLV